MSRRTGKRFLILPMILLLFLCGFRYEEEKTRVFDNADVLSDAQEQELEALCKEYSLKDQADYVILTSYGTDGKSARLYAADFYDSQGFGYNQAQGDGTIYLIDMDNREMSVVSTGKCMDYLTDDRREEILDATYEKAVDGDYYGSCKAYLEKTTYFLNKKPSKEGIFSNPIVNLLMAAVVSGVVVFVLAWQQKSTMTVSASDYSANLHTDPAGSRDIFVRTTTTKSKKSKSGSSTGGSFQGSSGTSHSGSSRKF